MSSQTTVASGLLRKTIPFPDHCLSFRTAAVFHNSISSFRFLQFGGFPWKSFRTVQTGCPNPAFSVRLSADAPGAQWIHHQMFVGVWPPCFGRFLSVPAAATQKTLHGAGRARKSNQGVLHHAPELAGNAPLPIHRIRGRAPAFSLPSRCYCPSRLHT